MRKHLISLLTLVALIIAGQGIGIAACTISQSQLAGTWQIYSTSGDPAAIEWTRIKMPILADGSIAGGAAVVNSDGEKSSLYGGSLIINAKCVIQGTILILAGGVTPIQVTVTHATANANVDVIMGVGFGTNGSPFQFMGIKR